jgi:hypothetical protein
MLLRNDGMGRAHMMTVRNVISTRRSTRQDLVKAGKLLHKDTIQLRNPLLATDDLESTRELLVHLSSEGRVDDRNGNSLGEGTIYKSVLVHRTPQQTHQC